MEQKYLALKETPEKGGKYKDTTSLRWKKEVIDFFYDKKLTNCLEIGTCQGITTNILSDLFEKVYTIENHSGCYNQAKELCKDKDNIEFHLADAYLDSSYIGFPEYFDVAVIDCMHYYEHVMKDINRSLTYFNESKGMYLVFDDYGHPEDHARGVKQAVDAAIQGGLKIETTIGEDPGFEVKRQDGSSFTLINKEGIILSYGI